MMLERKYGIIGKRHEGKCKLVFFGARFLGHRELVVSELLGHYDSNSDTVITITTSIS